jgi:hypothetical protein
MIVLAVVVCAAAVWMLLDAGHPPTDEEKYQRMRRSERRGVRMDAFRRGHRLPRSLDNALERLELRSFGDRDKREEELLASGYLVAFTVSNRDSSPLKLRTQLGSTTYWCFHQIDNVVSMTCRSNDAARIRPLLEKKP